MRAALSAAALDQLARRKEPRPSLFARAGGQARGGGDSGEAVGTSGARAVPPWTPEACVGDISAETSTTANVSMHEPIEAHAPTGLE